MPNRVAFVTGASRGIGRAIALRLCGSGHDIVVASPERENNESVAGEIRASGGRAITLDFNLTSLDSIKQGVAAALKEFGRIDVLVNNAGITKDGMFHKMTKEQWYAVINTNLKSLFNMTRPVWEGMHARKFGRVICISSINGQKGQMGQVNYSSAKAGDLGFVKALAQEGARAGITVNAICPGYIATEMVKAIAQDVLDKRILPLIPVGRLGEPEEIARAVVFLASDDAGFITGSTISANGGQYMI